MGDAVPFDVRVSEALAGLSPAEQRIARFFADRKETVLLAPAAEIAEQAGVSDATVVRTARCLGFNGLSALREVLLSELTRSPSPGRRMKRTLDEAGNSAAQALRHVVSVHEEALDVLKREDFAASFAGVVPILAGASQRHAFGVGPSGALAQYAALQFGRIGLPTGTLSARGIALADQLLSLNRGDVILMIAHAPLYREVALVLEQAGKLYAPVILISDSLAPLVADAICEVLPVPARTRRSSRHARRHHGAD